MRTAPPYRTTTLHRAGLRHQRGVFLIGLLLGIVLLSTILVSIFALQRRAYVENYATIEGNAMAQFAIGLRGFVAAVQADPASLPANPLVVNGVDFLKPPTCGGLATNPPEGFVPCVFTGQTFGQFYATTINRNAATNEIEARTTLIVPDLADGNNRVMTAARMAEGAMANQNVPSTGVFMTAFANVPENYVGPAPPVTPAVPDRGRVLLIVNNAPSNDLWLRVDGTNSMNANLQMGGFSIQNARDARFAGDLRVEGRAQVDNGLTVTSGTLDAREGVFARDGVVEATNKFLSQAINTGVVLTGSASYTVNKPQCCPPGALPGECTPDEAIYASLQSTGTGAHDALYDARVDVVDLGSQWSVTPVVRGADFALTNVGFGIQLQRNVVTTNPADARVMVLTKCR